MRIVFLYINLNLYVTLILVINLHSYVKFIDKSIFS